MKKPVSNIASAMTKRLIDLLSKLESTNYDKLNNEGKVYLDEIWKLLKMPTNAEMIEALKKHEEEE